MPDAVVTSSPKRKHKKKRHKSKEPSKSSKYSKLQKSPQSQSASFSSFADIDSSRGHSVLHHSVSPVAAGKRSASASALTSTTSPRRLSSKTEELLNNSNSIILGLDSSLQSNLHRSQISIRSSSPSQGQSNNNLYSRISALPIDLPIDENDEEDDDSLKKVKFKKSKLRRSKSSRSGSKEKDKDKKSRGGKSRSHSPVLRRNKKKKPSRSQSDTYNNQAQPQPQRPKSDKALNVSNHMDEENPHTAQFQDDTEIGTAAGKKKEKEKRKARRQKRTSHQSMESPSGLIESELTQMLGSMNGSGNFGEIPLADIDADEDKEKDAPKDKDGNVLDATLNSRASSKSKTKKKKRSSYKPGELDGLKKLPATPEAKKSSRNRNAYSVGDMAEYEREGGIFNAPKRTKSVKSSVSKGSIKRENKKKDKSNKKTDGDQLQQAPTSPQPSGSESASASASANANARKKKPKRRSSKTPVLIADPGVEDETKPKRRSSKTPALIADPGVEDEASLTKDKPSKTRKKKRASTKSRSPSRNSTALPAVSNHRSLLGVSDHKTLDTSGKSTSRKGRRGSHNFTDDEEFPDFEDGVEEKDSTRKNTNQSKLSSPSKPSPGTLRRIQSHDPGKMAKPGMMGARISSCGSEPTMAVLHRSTSFNRSPKPSPGSMKRTLSDKDAFSAGSKNGAGVARLRRARSLFGAVLNPNAKGAETVGDGEHSDNEYEMKPVNEKGKKPGLLGWAKKKMQPIGSPRNSPGRHRNRLGKGFFGTGTGADGDGDNSDDDQEGLLSNTDNHGGRMSLLNLMAVPPNEGGLDKDFVGEDNTIEESHEFKLPAAMAVANANHNTNTNSRNRLGISKPIGNKFGNNNNNGNGNGVLSAVDRRAIHVKQASADGDMPPFSQIISTAVITTEDDELSDIGDPEDNIRPLVQPAALEPEIMDGVEFIYNPERNDIVYDDKGHPGTIRMLHTVREILVEHEDGIEYSPEVYKVIKRRLKGRLFLVRAQHHENRTAWRQATKSENVRLLSDFFHEEMRNLFGQSITIHDKGFGDAEINHSAHNSPAKRSVNALPNKQNRMSGGGSDAGSIRDNLLQRAIAECKWAQELAQPNGDIETMNIGIDAEEKLISLIEIAEAGSERTAPLKEELDKLGELAKQMMYVSIAPLFERLEEIEENMADYYEQEELVEQGGRRDRSRSASGRERDRSMEKDGEMYEVAMKSESYEEEDLNFFDDEERNGEEGDDFHEEDEDGHHDGEGEYDDEESEELSETNVKEGEVLQCDNTSQGDVSSVGGSGLYDESESDEDDSDMEGEDKQDWVDFDDEEDDDDDEEGSETHEGTNSSDDYSDNSDEPIARKKTIFDEPNPKMKQFFDRLNHFFETRRRIKECAAKIDPSKKCRKIKAKAHSRGLAKKSGLYKEEFQQRDTNNKVVRNLNDLYEAAEAVQTDFKSIVQQLVNDISGLDFKKNIILPQLKSRDRAYEKAKTEYGSRNPGPPESWLYDIVRAGIVCNNVKQLSEVSKWLTSNSHVVQAKNRFSEPVFNGYQDLLYHVSIPYRDGMAHICEIQVHLKDIYVMNDQCGTIKHYHFFRSCFSNPWRSQEDTLSDLQKMNKYSKIEGPLMKKLLKSEEPEQLLLFAKIFFNKIEEYDRSLELYRRVLGLQENAHGSDNEEMADTYLRIGLVLGAMGDTEESLQNLLKALAIQESFLGEDHMQVADSYVEIGHMLAKRGDYSGAYTQYKRTQLIRENKLGKEHFLVIKSLQDIGLVLQKKGDFEESEREYRKALAIQKVVLGEGHSDLATTHSFIGKTLCLYGDFEKAMVENKLALSVREKGLGKNHRSTAESHTAIGLILFQQGDYKSSRWHHNKALKIRESMLGKDDEECAISHRHLGELLSCCDGDYDGAVKELKRTQEILEANVGRIHPVTAESYLDLGHIHCRHGKHEEALAEYRRAKVILESNLGQTHPETAVTYLCVGNALNLGGDQEGALQMHRKALVVFESVLGNSHPRTADGYQSTGDAFEASGNPEMALPEHLEALKIRKAVLRKDHPAVAESCARIGNILLTACDGDGNQDERDPNGALEIYREAMTITEERCGKDHPASAVARFDVSFALMAMAMNDKSGSETKLLGEAEDKLRETLEVLREIEPIGNKDAETATTNGFFLGFGEEAAITGRACVALGTVLEQNGNDEEAREMFVEGLERLIKVLGGDHPDTLAAESKLLSFVAES